MVNLYVCTSDMKVKVNKFFTMGAAARIHQCWKLISDREMDSIFQAIFKGNNLSQILRKDLHLSFDTFWVKFH